MDELTKRQTNIKLTYESAEFLIKNLQNESQTSLLQKIPKNFCKTRFSGYLCDDMKKLMTILVCVAALFACHSCKTPGEAPVRKVVMIIIDGVPTDMIERLHPEAIYDIASHGAFGVSYVGGEVGSYSQTPTISAVGYNTMLTGTWANKHNMWGNSGEPNYNYWSMFRIAKEQEKPLTTGLFSSWTDNRTVLLGEGLESNAGMKIDYVGDGYDLDEVAFPHKDMELHVFDYDEAASTAAAECIRNDAPDLSWVYLWYTDDAGHIKGNGEYFDEYTLKADEQIRRVWDAVQYRQESFNEDWMVIVTTDHGRTTDGHGHGGQSARERGSWIAVNQAVGTRFKNGGAAMVDINPTVCQFLGMEVPLRVRMEQDGISFIGETIISNMNAIPYDDTAILTWDSHVEGKDVTVYMAKANDYRTTGQEDWQELGTVKSGDGIFKVDLAKAGDSDFYKFALVTEHECLNRWLQN